MFKTLAALVLGALVLLATSRPAPASSPPWDSSLPAGGVVIFTSPESRLGAYGYPVRVVKIADECLTQTWQANAGPGWVSRETRPCVIP